VTRVAGLPPGRLVITDDAVAIRASAYASPDGPPTVVVLSALVALRLAAELLAAATRHLVAERNHAAGVRRGVP
jgi:hypothetical protein